MLRIFLWLVTFVLCLGGAVSAETQSTASSSRRHVVEIRAFSFQPQRAVVAPGDTIVWINRDIVPHTVTADGGTWRSHALEEGQTWEIVVENREGASYFCEFHPHMTGVVAAW